MSKRIVVRGWWHPPPVTDPTYPGFLLRTDELDRFCKSMKGKPAYVEHVNSGPVGKVDRIWQDTKKGALGVDLAIDATNAGFDVTRRIMSRELKGLSFGSRVFRDEQYNRTSEHDPKEISIVEKGDIPGTHIFAFAIDDKVFVSPQHSVYLANSARKPTAIMSTESNVQADQTQDDILSGVSRDTLIEAMRVFKEQKEREAEQERLENEQFDQLVNEKLHKDWEKAILEKKIEYDPLFGAGIAKASEFKEGRALIKCLASALSGNFSSLEQKRLEIQQEQSKAGLTTFEERKQPSKFTSLFSKPEPPAAPAEPAQIPVDMQNSSKKREKVATTDLFSNPEKRAKLVAMMQKEIRDGEAKN